MTDAHVSKLVFDGARCRGADYTVGNLVHRVEVEHEVVLCAGAVGTPQLMMLSGIGPATHLRDVGIDVLVDVPGAGQNLLDHPVCWITFGAAAPLPSTTGAPHVLLRSGATIEPDIQIGFAPVVIGPRWTHRPEPGFSILFSLMTPTSRGSVQLSGPDTHDPLLIDPAYFTQAEDLNRMVIGFRRAREITDANALTPWRGEPIEPALDTSDEDACRAYIRASAGPYFHPVGTCRIGTDGLAS